MYYRALDDLMWQLSMTTSSPEFHRLAQSISKHQQAVAAAIAKPAPIPSTPTSSSSSSSSSSSDIDYQTASDSKITREFWRESLAGDEPYRVVLAHTRERMFVTRKWLEYSVNGELQKAHKYLVDKWQQLQLKPFQHKAELLAPLRSCYDSLVACGDGVIANGKLKDLMRQIDCFGMSLCRLDIRQESDRHAEAIDAITQYLGVGSYLKWNEQQRQQFCSQELENKRPLMNWSLFLSSSYCNDNVREVLLTFQMISHYASYLGAYVISMAHTASDVLAVRLLQKEAGVKKEEALRVVPLFEMEADLKRAGEVIQ